MALFGNKKEKKVEKEATVSKEVSNSTKVQTTTPNSVFKGEDKSWVIKKPRITEKGTITIEKANAYVFDVNESANKYEVAKAVYDKYKVKPIKVNLARVLEKKVRTRRSIGVKGGGKKAFVYLKKGDKIEIV